MLSILNVRTTSYSAAKIVSDDLWLFARDSEYDQLSYYNDGEQRKNIVTAGEGKMTFHSENPMASWNYGRPIWFCNCWHVLKKKQKNDDTKFYM